MAHPEIEIEDFPKDFHEMLGKFHCAWLMFDPLLDYSIGKFLNISFEQTHILVAGMEFGKKLRLLIELLKRSNFEKKSVMIESLRTLQGSKRDVITHSYIASDEKNLSFIFKARGGYGASVLNFKIDEFSEHVLKMIVATQKFQDALSADVDELRYFGLVSLNIK